MAAGSAPNRCLLPSPAGDGTLVAALSLADGTVVGDPFRYTLEAVARFGQGRRARRRLRWRRAHARQVLKRISARQAAVAGTVLAAVLIGASTGQAAPKPGLPAGPWVGTGTANGTSTEVACRRGSPPGSASPSSSEATGGSRGTGSFASHMTTSGSISSEVASTANIVFRGTSTDIAYTGTASTRARFASITRTLKPITIRQRLPISRAGACRAAGGFTLYGLAFHWTAAKKSPAVPNLIHHPAVEHRVSRYRLVRGDAKPVENHDGSRITTASNVCTRAHSLTGKPS